MDKLREGSIMTHDNGDGREKERNREGSNYSNPTKIHRRKEKLVHICW